MTRLFVAAFAVAAAAAFSAFEAPADIAVVVGAFDARRIARIAGCAALNGGDLHFFVLEGS